LIVNNRQAFIIALMTSKLENMENIREILANNMKENRRKCGFSQVKLAEQANVSTQYIAMIETCSKFPKPEMLERLAKALGIETHQLFNVSTSSEEVLKRLHQSIVTDIQQGITDMKQAVAEAVKEALAGECTDKGKT
jgi:transcriptional regulator with XRE-family HTH domain